MTPEEFHSEWCVDDYAQEACRRGDDCLFMKQLRSVVSLQVGELQKDVVNWKGAYDSAVQKINEWSGKAVQISGEKSEALIKLQESNRQVLGLRTAFTYAVISPSGDCRICGATSGMAHYPDSPCKILNPATENQNGDYIMHQMSCPTLTGSARCLCQPITIREKWMRFREAGKAGVCLCDFDKNICPLHGIAKELP